MPCDTTGKNSDILSKPWLPFVFYCLPAIAIVAIGYAPLTRGWRTRILGFRPDRHGSGAYCQCYALQASPLLCHRSLLSTGGAGHSSLWLRYDSAWSEWLERDRHDDPYWSDRSRLPPRAVVWEVSGKLSLRYYCRW